MNDTCLDGGALHAAPMTLPFGGQERTIHPHTVGDYVGAECELRRRSLRDFLDETERQMLPPEARGMALAGIAGRVYQDIEVLSSFTGQAYLGWCALGRPDSFDQFIKTIKPTRLLELTNLVLVASGMKTPEDYMADPLLARRAADRSAHTSTNGDAR
jgi:hypothetical protein